MLNIKHLIYLSIFLITSYIFSSLFINFNSHPYEDAAMTMRYAFNLANGHGIVWNVGEQPVSGSNDFLFIIIVGGLKFIGLSIESAVLSVNIFSFVLILFLLYYALNKIFNAGILATLFVCLFFIFSPILFISSAYFGTVFFSLFVLSTWILALNIIIKGKKNRSYFWLFSISSLLMGMSRAEGCIIALFMFISLLFSLNRKQIKDLFIIFTFIFLFFGGAYLIWRWNYFGYLFPNPFYIKEGGSLYLESLQESTHNVRKLSLPFIICLFSGFVFKDTRKISFQLFIPVFGATLMWMIISNCEICHGMNFAGRYQFPVMVILLLSWYPPTIKIFTNYIKPKLKSFNKKTSLSLNLIYIFLLIFVLAKEIESSRKWTRQVYIKDGRYDVAIMLKKYIKNNYTMAVTEAGLLPLYSTWKTLDAYGYNDSWIAHNGIIDKEYLSNFSPEIIMWHEYFSPITPPKKERENDSWFKMVKVLKDYAEENEYVLAAVYGVQSDNTHYYYVSPNIVEKDEIVSSIKNMDYYWYESGQISTNFNEK